MSDTPKGTQAALITTTRFQSVTSRRAYLIVINASLLMKCCTLPKPIAFRFDTFTILYAPSTSVAPPDRSPFQDPDCSPTRRLLYQSESPPPVDPPPNDWQVG
jgi:hypothetical protein